jgi:hypothetical protein
VINEPAGEATAWDRLIDLLLCRITQCMAAGKRHGLQLRSFHGTATSEATLPRAPPHAKAL